MLLTRKEACRADIQTRTEEEHRVTSGTVNKEKASDRVTADGSSSTLEEELEEGIKKVPIEEDDENPFSTLLVGTMPATLFSRDGKALPVFPGNVVHPYIVSWIFMEMINVNQHFVYVLIAQ